MMIVSSSAPRQRLAAWGLVALAACDPNGFPHFNEPLDLTGTCDPLSTTWIRMTGQGTEQATTEMLIVGHALDGIDPAASGCLYRVEVSLDGSVVLEQGVYRFDEDAAYEGTVESDFRYTFVHQDDVSVMNRRGAYREALEPALERRVALSRTGSRLEVDLDGEVHRYDELMPLVEQLDLDDPDELVYAARLFNVGLLISQVRVLGFGGAGMTHYTEPASFEGLISGALHVSVELGIDQVHTVLRYDNFSDLPGVVHQGPQGVEVNWSGTGTMTGVTTLTFAHGVLSPTFLEAHMDSSRVEIVDGFGSAGVVGIEVGDNAYEVPMRDIVRYDFEGM